MLPSKRHFDIGRKALELLIGFLLLALMLGLGWTGALNSFENLFLDLRFQIRGERPFSQDVAVVGIGESSLDLFGRWPWPRDRHAALAGLLRNSAFRPSVFSYDLLFENRDTRHPEADDALVFQIRNFRSPVLMPYFFEKGAARIYERDASKESFLQKFAIPNVREEPRALESADKASLPFIELAKLSRLAFVNAPVDPDGRSRRTQLLMKFENQIYPSLDLLSAVYHLGLSLEEMVVEKDAIVLMKDGREQVRIPVNEKGEMLVNYYGSFENIPALSYLDAMNAGKSWMSGGDGGERLKIMKDRIVLVGVTALGLEDRRVTPFNQYEPGIGLHAQALANIVENDFLREAPRRVSLAAGVFAGLIAILLTSFLRITRSLPAILLLAAGYFAAAYVFFTKGIWIQVAAPEAAIGVVFIGMTSFRYFTALEDLKRTQEQLIHSAKMASIGQLSAGISHEFRNILNAILLHVDFCSRPGMPIEKIMTNMERVKGVVKKANLILNGLLTFARKSESKRVPGDLKKTIQDTVLLAEKQLMYHEISVEQDLDDVGEVAYDEGQISQVILNLINNGRDAMAEKEGKVITLRLKPHPKGVQLDIGDNGSGIPPKVMKRLFEPFVTSKAAGKGTGLGLSVCYGIIRNHGGDITVTTARDKGTTWHIVLPAKAPVGVPAEDSSETEKPAA